MRGGALEALLSLPPEVATTTLHQHFTRGMTPPQHRLCTFSFSVLSGVSFVLLVPQYPTSNWWWQVRQRGEQLLRCLLKVTCMYGLVCWWEGTTTTVVCFIMILSRHAPERITIFASKGPIAVVLWWRIPLFMDRSDIKMPSFVFQDRRKEAYLDVQCLRFLLLDSSRRFALFPCPSTRRRSGQTRASWPKRRQSSRPSLPRISPFSSRDNDPNSLLRSTGES